MRYEMLYFGPPHGQRGEVAGESDDLEQLSYKAKTELRAGQRAVIIDRETGRMEVICPCDCE